MIDYILRNRVLFIILFVAIVAPSFFFGALQFILGLILFLFIAALIWGWLFRVRFMGQMGGQNREQPSNKTFNQSQKRGRDDVGEYVDFEEIKDDKK